MRPGFRPGDTISLAMVGAYAVLWEDAWLADGVGGVVASELVLVIGSQLHEDDHVAYVMTRKGTLGWLITDRFERVDT